MCGDDDITIGKGEFSYTKAQLEQKVWHDKMAQEKQREHEAYTTAASDEGAQGIEDSTSSPATEEAEMKVDDAPKNAKELHAHPEYEDIIKSGKLEIKQLFDMGVCLWNHPLKNYAKSARRQSEC